MSVLRIRDVTKSFDGLVEMEIRSEEFDDVLWFQLPSGFRPHSDQVAAAVAAIFGSKFKKVEFLEPISASMRTSLSKATSTDWQAPELSLAPAVGGANSSLSFSGGFDSLAALAVVGPDANLVSLDFGKKFSREQDFYKQFNTTTLETNAREFESSWTFMGIGAILLREYFRADYFAFGSILEASPWHFASENRPASIHRIFGAAGLKAINPILGLTEFETTKLAAVSFPELILDSLTSLADPHTEKYLRKLLMLKYLDNFLNLELDFSLVEEPTLSEPITWGSSFAADFLAPGMFKYCGEEANKWMRLPEASKDYFSQLDGGFYWSENTALKTQLPKKLRQTIASNKAILGVESYGPTEWRNFIKLAKLLTFNHKIPAFS